jgi:hypothetical protein
LISVALTYASTRYRAIAEGALVVLAAVAIDSGVQRWMARRRTPDDTEVANRERVDERVLTGP